MRSSLATARSLSPADRAAFRAQLQWFAARHGMCAADLDRMSGVHWTQIWKVMRGQIPPGIGMRKRMVQAMVDYDAAHPDPEKVQRDCVNRPLTPTPATLKVEKADGDYRASKAARTVVGALNYAAKNRLSGGIFGDPGRGKTKAVRYWSATTSYPHLLLSCRAYSPYGTILRAIAAVLMGTADLRCTLSEADDIVHAELAERPRLLVLDEADMLGGRTLDWLRSILDESDGQSNIVLVGKPAFYARLQSIHATSKQDLRQVWSRLAFRKFLPDIERADTVAAISAADLAAAFDDAATAALHEAAGGSYRDLAMMLRMVPQLLADNPEQRGKITPAAVAKLKDSRFGAEIGRRR